MATSCSRIYVLDFDGTITTKDTITAIAEVAISFQARKGMDLRPAWDGVVDAYSKDYASFVEGYIPKKEDRRTLLQEIEFCRALRGVEGRSFQRVSESGLFKGIEEDEWEELGKEAVTSGNVEIRKGFGDFVEDVIRRQETWAIVSVNFSRGFIRGVLSSAGNWAKDVKVLANQSGLDGFLKGPKLIDGSIGEVMATSDAKLSALNTLLKMDQNSTIPEVFYIGDSGTDIECLTANEIKGIIMADDWTSSLLRSMDRIGIAVEHIAQWRKKRNGEAENIVWACDFVEMSKNLMAV